jgi:hypothetical protein
MKIEYLANGLLCTYLIIEIYKFSTLICKRLKTSEALSNFESNRLRSYLEQSISLDTLGELIRSNNVLMKRSALQILIDRGVSDAHLPYILNACRAPDPRLRSGGFSALIMMAKSEMCRQKLIQHDALEIVNQTLMMELGEETLSRILIIILYYLSHGNINVKRYMAHHGTIRPLLNMIQSSSSRMNDLVYWALVVIYQMALVDELCPYLNKEQTSRTLVSTLQMANGHTSVEKLCYHSLVRLIDCMVPEGIS